MTDSVLTEKEVNTMEQFAMRWSNEPRQLAKPCVRLCKSHRLQAARIQELEKLVEESRYGY